MAIIDSQVHAYEANTPKRPWHRVPNWPDHVTGDEMVAAMDRVGVDGAIFLWGTDWTRAFAVVNYEQAVEPFRHTDRLSDSERAMLMGGACAKAYRWSPTKP
jgi:hypothetical protein